MTAAAKGSVSAPMLITKDEATAAQRTVLFHLVLTADQANATGLVPVVTLSKAGAAFGAAAGVVSELANGWYKIVLAAADVDTLGQLAMHAEVALADSLDVVHQVVAFDLNVATVALTAGSLVAASFGAGAIDAAAIAADALGSSEAASTLITEVQAGLATAAAVAALSVPQVTAMVGMGLRTTDGNFTAYSMLNAIDALLTFTGTWGGATVTAQVCEDPQAAVPVWTNIGTPLTANGTILITGPHNAFRAVLSGDEVTTSITGTAAIRKASN